MGLPRAIIKKYGISKKAWSVYRGSKGSRSGGVSRKMAKKRHSGRKNGGGSGNLMGVMVGGAVYGAGRTYLSNLVAPVTNKMPGGVLADNLVLGAVCYFAAKKIKNKTIKNIARSGLAIEAALAGQDLVANGFNLSAGSSGSNFDY